MSSRRHVIKPILIVIVVLVVLNVALTFATRAIKEQWTASLLAEKAGDDEVMTVTKIETVFVGAAGTTYGAPESVKHTGSDGTFTVKFILESADTKEKSEYVVYDEPWVRLQDGEPCEQISIGDKVVMKEDRICVLQLNDPTLTGNLPVVIAFAAANIATVTIAMIMLRKRVNANCGKE
jgi:hypothetical protein